MTTVIAKRMGMSAGGLALVCLIGLAATSAGAQSADQKRLLALAVPIVGVDLAASTITAGPQKFKVTNSTRILDAKGLNLSMRELKSKTSASSTRPGAVPSPSDLRWAKVKGRAGTDELVELQLTPASGDE